MGASYKVRPDSDLMRAYWYGQTELDRQRAYDILFDRVCARQIRVYEQTTKQEVEIKLNQMLEEYLHVESDF